VQTRIGQLGFFDNPFFGTSAAAPHVAAIAALMLDINPSLTPAQVSSILNSTAVDIGTPGYDNESGFGRIDAFAAAQAVSIASGDYNRNGVVDAADYVLWRKTVGTSVASYTGADGSGNASVGQEDYGVWRSHFGQTLPAPGAGSGSLALTSEPIAAPTNVPQSAIAKNRSKSLEEVVGITSTDSEIVHSSLFATAAPINSPSATLGRVRQEHVRDGGLLSTTVRQDAGLLAWLSTRSAERFDNSRVWAEEGHDRSPDDGDQYHDAVDSVFDDLSVSLVRDGTDSLISVA